MRSGPSGPSNSEPPLPSKSTIALGVSLRLSMAVSTLLGPSGPASHSALRLAEKPVQLEPASTLTNNSAGWPGSASFETLRRASRSSQAPSSSGCSLRKRACSARYAGKRRKAAITAAPISADAGSGAAIVGAGRLGSTASSAPLQGAENSATSVRPPTADNRQISRAIVSGGMGGPSAQPSQCSAVRGSGVICARSAKRCKRVSQTAPVAPSTFTGRPSQPRSACGSRSTGTLRVALLSPVSVIGPSAQAGFGLASSRALLSSASHSPGCARSGLSAALGGAVLSEESASGARPGGAQALAFGSAFALALALTTALGRGSTGVAVASFGFFGGSLRGRQASDCVASRAQPSAQAPSSSFEADITLERLAAQQAFQSRFIDHARAELFGGVGLGFADLFADHQIAGALLDLVVHLSAGRADRVVHVFALAREHAGDAERRARERPGGGGARLGLRSRDLQTREFLEQAAIFRVLQVAAHAVHHLRSEARDLSHVLEHVVRAPGDQILQRLGCFGQLLGGDLPDVLDANAGEQAIERLRARLLDRGDHVFGALLAHALERLDLRHSQLVQIGHVRRELARDQLFDQGLTQVIDVHREAA